jgi:hypothetical protein
MLPGKKVWSRLNLAGQGVVVSRVACIRRSAAAMSAKSPRFDLGLRPTRLIPAALFPPEKHNSDSCSTTTVPVPCSDERMLKSAIGPADLVRAPASFTSSFADFPRTFKFDGVGRSLCMAPRSNPMRRTRFSPTPAA